MGGKEAEVAFGGFVAHVELEGWFGGGGAWGGQDASYGPKQVLWPDLGGRFGWSEEEAQGAW